MIVIADTTPFNYLVQMNRVEMMRVLYGEIYIPQEVLLELTAAGTPAKVRHWATTLPTWIQVSRETQTYDPELLELDAGESAAIALALRLGASLLLMDERTGRAVAARKGIPVSGTLGVLRDGAKRGLISFDEALAGLLALGFRASAAVIKEARKGLEL